MKKAHENCHNCGAVVRGQGLVKCQYCGTEYLKEYERINNNNSGVYSSFYYTASSYQTCRPNPSLTMYNPIGNCF
jgi:hypothetical protein